MVKNKTFWGVLGITLFTIGFLLTVSFALRSSSFPYAIIAGVIALSGILLIAWVWGE